jgi:hypothetical protein
LRLPIFAQSGKKLPQAEKVLSISRQMMQFSINAPEYPSSFSSAERLPALRADFLDKGHPEGYNF